MSHVMLREDLLDSFQRLQGQFKSSLAEATALDARFTTLHHQFRINMASHLTSAGSKLAQNNPLSGQIASFLQAIAQTDDGWNAKLLSRDKGIQFRQRFNDSLLVFIYGKVKSGKSSLGNYMAWGNTDPDDGIKSCQPGPSPDFFSHENTHASNGDAVDEALTRQEFRTGATEATSSIQGFSLPGLTWIDSPGLHSVKTQNGQLAQEYAEHADLILYTMSSSSPGRESDIKELQSLQSKGKSVLILITGSDFNEEDWDEASQQMITTVMMKSEQTRREQREYVAAEAGGLSASSVLSLSARYAQLHARDADKMADSGAGQLFDTLHRISQQEGIRVKRNVPLNNFRLFMEGCLDELPPYQQLISGLEQEIEKLEQSVPRVMTSRIREAQSAIGKEIEHTFRDLESKRNDERLMNEALRKARHHLNTVMQQVAQDALKAGFADIIASFDKNVTHQWQHAALNLPDFSVDKVTEHISVGVNKGTRGRNSGVGGFLGGALGFVVGGPPGAAIGSAAGAALGSATGSNAKVTTRTVEIPTGDNLTEIASKTLKIYTQSIEKSLREQSDALLGQQLTDIRQMTGRLREELNSVEGVFASLIRSAEQKINSENCS